MDLNAAIAVLMGQDRETVIKALEKDAGAIHQTIFQAGHNVGYGKKHGELTAAQAKVTELEGTAATLRTDLEAARQDKPDLAALHKQYQDAAAETQRTHHEALLRVTGQLKAGAIDTAVRDLRGALEKRCVEPEYAQMLSEKADLRARLKPSEDGGGVQILQAGKDIPIAPSGALTALDVLANEIFAVVPERWIVAKTDTGSGDRSGGAPKGAALYDGIRKQVAEQGKAQTDQRAKALEAIGT